jgi:hypothetical protein
VTEIVKRTFTNPDAGEKSDEWMANSIRANDNGTPWKGRNKSPHAPRSSQSKRTSSSSSSVSVAAGGRGVVRAGKIAMAARNSGCGHEKDLQE